MTDETRAALLALPDTGLEWLIVAWETAHLGKLVTADVTAQARMQADWLRTHADEPLHSTYWRQRVAALRAALAEEREA